MKIATGVEELEADVMLEADYSLRAWRCWGPAIRARCSEPSMRSLRHQNEDGGWSLYPGGPSNINYGVKSYLALS